MPVRVVLVLTESEDSDEPAQTHTIEKRLCFMFLSSEAAQKPKVGQFVSLRLKLYTFSTNRGLYTDLKNYSANVIS